MTEESDKVDRRSLLRGDPVRKAVDDASRRIPRSATPAERSGDWRDNTSETRGAAVDLDAILARAEAMNGSEASYAPADFDGGDSGKIPPLRPPGALEEERFREVCTGCGDCADACPHGSITLLPERFGELAGTPTIDVLNNPCQMCEDVPCISACDEIALRPLPPLKIGRAEIREHDCFAHNSQVCSVCVEHCPRDGALELKDGKPVVDTELCSGCGICHSVCPAPSNAVLIMPPRY